MHMGRRSKRNPARRSGEPPALSFGLLLASRGEATLGRRQQPAPKIWEAVMFKGSLAAIVALAAILTSGTAMAGKDLDAVKARGTLICGVGTGLAGFYQPDDKGKWAGLDVDVCRAIAATIFGDSEKVKYVPLTAQQ